MFLGQGDEALQGCQVHHPPGGVARGADVEELAPSPGGCVHRVEVREKARLGRAGQVTGFGPGQQGGPLVDLVERVGHQHQGGAVAVHHRLGEGEQRLAGAVERQDLALRV